MRAPVVDIPMPSVLEVSTEPINDENVPPVQMEEISMAICQRIANRIEHTISSIFGGIDMNIAFQEVRTNSGAKK